MGSQYPYVYIVERAGLDGAAFPRFHPSTSSPKHSRENPSELTFRIQTGCNHVRFSPKRRNESSPSMCESHYRTNVRQSMTDSLIVIYQSASNANSIVTPATLIDPSSSAPGQSTHSLPNVPAPYSTTRKRSRLVEIDLRTRLTSFDEQSRPGSLRIGGKKGGRPGRHRTRTRGATGATQTTLRPSRNRNGPCPT